MRGFAGTMRNLTSYFYIRRIGHHYSLVQNQRPLLSLLSEMPEVRLISLHVTVDSRRVHAYFAYRNSENAVIVIL